MKSYKKILVSGAIMSAIAIAPLAFAADSTSTTTGTTTPVMTTTPAQKIVKKIKTRIVKAKKAVVSKVKKIKKTAAATGINTATNTVTPTPKQ